MNVERLIRRFKRWKAVLSRGLPLTAWTWHGIAFCGGERLIGAKSAQASYAPAHLGLSLRMLPFTASRHPVTKQLPCCCKPPNVCFSLLTA